MSIKYEIVFDVDPFVLTEFLKLHAVQKRLVNAIGDAAAESRGVVVLLDLPYRNWVDRAREGAVYSTRKRADWNTITRNCSQFSRIVAAFRSRRIRLD